MLRTIFTWIENACENDEFEVVISMAEVYMERVNDLIDVTRKDLKVVDQKGKGTVIQDVSEHFCCNEQEVYNLILKGLKQRKVCET